MSKAAQGFSLRRTGGTPQTASSQAAGANPRRTPLIGKRAIYGWKIAGGGATTAHIDPGITYASVVFHKFV